MTQTLKFFNDVWVRKTLIHPWVLLMVGLGWYLDVIGSDSHVLVWVSENFGGNYKSAKKRKTAVHMSHFRIFCFRTPFICTPIV